MGSFSGFLGHLVGHGKTLRVMFPMKDFLESQNIEHHKTFTDKKCFKKLVKFYVLNFTNRLQISSFQRKRRKHSRYLQIQL